MNKWKSIQEFLLLYSKYAKLEETPWSGIQMEEGYITQQ